MPTTSLSAISTPADSLHAVVVGNGDFQPTERAQSAVRSAELVIAADGGARHCRALDRVPDVVVGDLDSLEKADLESLRAGGSEIVNHSTAKDETDLELALLLAVERGSEEITMLGITGGRLDMTVANVLLLTHPGLRSTTVELWVGEQTAWLLSPPGGQLRGERGDSVSLIPLGAAVKGITTRDLRFSLSAETLEVGPARGVSNLVTGPGPGVVFDEGQLLIVHTPEPQ